MMSVTCFNCHRQFNVDETAIAEELARLKEEKARHHTIECPHCRKVNKIALSRLTGGRHRRRRRQR